MSEKIHIIGGTFRGKKLLFPNQPDLRPTPNRIRETLFNWLMQDLRESHCLDAFAGSGALGFEALSRGAKKVTFIESHQKTFSALRTNTAQFPETTQLKIELRNQTIDIFLTQPQEHLFDIIFIDPPFRQEAFFSESFLNRFLPFLSTSGKVYIEAPKALCLNDAIWITLKQKKAGDVHYGLYQKFHYATASSI